MSRWPAGPAVETIGRVTRRLRGSRGKPERLRAQRLSRDVRRAQLLEAALTAFARDGVSATTMDSIAATAGVSKPLVYQYFPNKRAALLAVVEQHCGLLLDVLGAASPARGSAGLARQFATYLDFARSHPIAFHLLFRAVDGTDLAATERIAAARRSIGDACLRASVGPGVGVPEWVGDALCALVEGVAIRCDPALETEELGRRLSRFVRVSELRTAAAEETAAVPALGSEAGGRWGPGRHGLP